MNEGRKPVFRKLDYGALARAAAGPVRPDVVYRFRDRRFVERPGHNPFREQPPDGGGN